MSPYLIPSPAQTRAALLAHLSRKLGWSGRTAQTLLGPLSNDDLSRCLRCNAEATREALFDRMYAALGATVTRAAFAADLRGAA